MSITYAEKIAIIDRLARLEAQMAKPVDLPPSMAFVNFTPIYWSGSRWQVDWPQRERVFEKDDAEELRKDIEAYFVANNECMRVIRQSAELAEWLRERGYKKG